MPEEYLDVLAVANGFATERGFFRFFSVGGACTADVDEWNGSPWKDSYGDLFRDVVLIAEDVFGDQYGYLPSGPLAKVHCEGAGRQPIEGSLDEFLRRQVLCDSPTAFDLGLANAAWDSGLRPGPDEHLAFRLPLIAGGAYCLDNLGVESVALHLGSLGQISVKNGELLDGTRIRRFLAEG